MNFRTIQEGIYYVGVNDRTTDKFEQLWPLPYGVSYNSYIVKGEKTALIDSVEPAEFPALMEHLKEVGAETIEYLVVNHCEPDHSGSIPLILKAFPEIKIIANKQCVAMIKGFYHVADDSRFITVADGEIIDLGGCTLKFFMTPMVHWPETMMTWVEERALLFTGDAFGTFGALNGAIVDNETDDIDFYLSEGCRYYSCIVGKYGKFVQRAIQKVAPLNPQYLCPTHGPVWNSSKDRIIDLYDRLSRYEGEQGTVIVYGSMYGNTADVAEEIALKLAELGERKIKVYNAAKTELSIILADTFRYDGLIVGAPTYSMTLYPPVDTFMKALATRELTHRTLGLFGSFTWASASLKKLEEYAEAMKLPVVAKLEIKQSLAPERKKDLDEFASLFLAELKQRRNS